MTQKQSLLKQAEQNGLVYPKFKVIFGLGLTGGAVGGFLIWLVFLVAVTEEGVVLSMLGLCMGFGTVIGGIPALLTGIYLAIRQFVIVNVMDYGWLFLIGALITTLYMVLIFNWIDIIELKYLLSFSPIVGGLSAMICGAMFVPKWSNMNRLE